MNGKKEFGDYQTPESFAQKVCKLLKENLKLNPTIVIEPTSGIGNFIHSALNTFTEIRQIYGIEINSEYCDICRERIADDRLQIINVDFFSYEIEKLIQNEDLLFLGNPPWATNSKLLHNLPDKTNFKQLKGIDAITGASNFDISEYIILKLVEKSIGKNISIAMLCKTSVARNILMEIDRRGVPIDCVRMYEFDSSSVFDVSVSACLLYIKMSVNKKKYIDICEVLDIDHPDTIENVITFSDGKIKNVVTNVVDLDGVCEFEWRQGIKHDCARVMELSKKPDGTYVNKNKKNVEIEDTLVFPLMKSSSFKQPLIKSGFSKYVIVTQKKAREETQFIESIAPNTWKYLNDNKALFDARKSSIYRGTPDFSMFGVGDYSYSKYKVGISGFYKKPLFSLLYNSNEIVRPVMVDDTAYFISFDNYSDAYVCMLLLNSEIVQQFLQSISFKDAKRPYTKKVLQRLEIKKCIEYLQINDLKQTEKNLGLSDYISDEMYKKFVSGITT